MSEFVLEELGYRVYNKECPRSEYCPGAPWDGDWVMWNNLAVSPYDAASCATCGEPLDVVSFKRCQAVLDYEGKYQCVLGLDHTTPHNAGWAEGNDFYEEQEGWTAQRDV